MNRERMLAPQTRKELAKFAAIQLAQLNQPKILPLKKLIEECAADGSSVCLRLTPLIGSGISAYRSIKFNGAIDKNALLRLMLHVHNSKFVTCDQEFLKRVRSSTLKKLSEDRSRISYSVLIRYFAAAGYGMQILITRIS